MADGKKLSTITWKDFKQLPLTEKGAYFQGTPPHTLIAQQFTREKLEELCALATRIKRINKRREGANFLKTLLSDKHAMLYFAQPSSRTYLSFEAACLILGLDTMDVRDSKTSSEVKGESPEDTLRTFSSYADLIIMRHSKGGFAERVAWMMSHTGREISVLNAGSGRISIRRRHCWIFTRWSARLRKSVVWMESMWCLWAICCAVVRSVR